MGRIEEDRARTGQDGGHVLHSARMNVVERTDVVKESKKGERWKSVEKGCSAAWHRLAGLWITCEEVREGSFFYFKKKNVGKST